MICVLPVRIVAISGIYLEKGEKVFTGFNDEINSHFVRGLFSFKHDYIIVGKDQYEDILKHNNIKLGKK